MSNELRRSYSHNPSPFLPPITKLLLKGSILARRKKIRLPDHRETTGQWEVMEEGSNQTP